MQGKKQKREKAFSQGSRDKTQGGKIKKRTIRAIRTIRTIRARHSRRSRQNVSYHYGIPYCTHSRHSRASRHSSARKPSKPGSHTKRGRPSSFRRPIRV